MADDWEAMQADEDYYVIDENAPPDGFCIYVPARSGMVSNYDRVARLLASFGVASHRFIYRPRYWEIIERFLVEQRAEELYRFAANRPKYRSLIVEGDGCRIADAVIERHPGCFDVLISIGAPAKWPRPTFESLKAIRSHATMDEFEKLLSLTAKEITTHRTRIEG